MAKPKIWGHCAAGCEWEVPHKSDFDAYRKIASRFPEPEVEAGKRLIEGAGYYYIMAGELSFGIVYWDGETPSQTSFCGVDSEDMILFNIRIGSDGSLTLRKGDVVGGTISDVTENAEFRTAKIVDIELPEQAEEVEF